MINYHFQISVLHICTFVKKGYASAFFAPSLSNSSVDKVATGCKKADILLSKLRQYSNNSALEILAVGGDPLTCIIPHLFGISSSFGYSQ